MPSYLALYSKALRLGPSLSQRKAGEVPERDDAGPALEFVPKPKLADDAAGAGFADSEHQAGDGRVGKCTYAALLDVRTCEP